MQDQVLSQSILIISCRFGGGVPCKQYRLIQKDGLRISQYIARTLDGAAMHSHLRKDNYFYFNCCTGRFSRDSCPSYLTPANFQQLKRGDVDRLEVMNGVFMQALMSRKFTKVPFCNLCDDQKGCQGSFLSFVVWFRWPCGSGSL